ncbi:hypothetical protein VaNZ11_013964 [Volvox africanus]|uniref:Alpha-ketoglutarate-dependent dioxygenase AlkB-like domain-containing protein n=1 Tax=Volvox africanus TaxID=51714 RepID=A0ABQ5SIA2_9CHLO|nr:hypothetical protein VaNZ11_013964 [Volvox africanus]
MAINDSRLDSLLRDLFDDEARDVEESTSFDAEATGQLARHKKTQALRSARPRPPRTCENETDKGLSNDLKNPLLKTLKDSMQRHDYRLPGNPCSWDAKGTQPSSAARVLRPLPGLSIIRQALSETQQLAAASNILSSGCLALEHVATNSSVENGGADGSLSGYGCGGRGCPTGLPNQALFFGDLPPWALHLISLLPLGDLLPPDLAAREPSFDQAIVNLYRPGEGITPHVDLARFQDGIVGVSIGGPVVMHFTRCGPRVSRGGHNSGFSTNGEGCGPGAGATCSSSDKGHGGASAGSAGSEGCSPQGCNQRPRVTAAEQALLDGAHMSVEQAASHPPCKRQRCVMQPEGCLEALSQLPASPLPLPQQRQQRQNHPDKTTEDADRRCDTAGTAADAQQQQHEQADGGCGTCDEGVCWCGTDHLSVLLQGGDLLGLSGEARYDWEHGIRMVASELWGERVCHSCKRGTAAVATGTAVPATRGIDPLESSLSELESGWGMATEKLIGPGKQQAPEPRLKAKEKPSSVSALVRCAEEVKGVESTADIDRGFGGHAMEAVREPDGEKREGASDLIPIVRGVRLSVTFRRLCQDIVLCEM